MRIENTEGPRSGSFVAYDGEKKAGEATYLLESGNMVIDHVVVSPQFRGRNVGKLLVEEAVANARKTKRKIVPICIFAKKMFERFDELKDVL